MRRDSRRGSELRRRGNYQKYRSRNPVQRFLIWQFHRSATSLLKSTGATSILDVGCGEGFTIERLVQANSDWLIQGLDNYLCALLHARERNPGVVVYHGDVQCLPFLPGAFEVVLCLEVLEHLADPLPALQELHRVTSEYSVLSVPNEPYFMAANLLRGKNVRAWGNDPEHIHRWTSREFLRMISAHFRLRKVRYPFPWVVALCTKS